MREGGLQIRSGRRLADDGKRLEALDVVFRRDSFIYKGGSLREGGLQVRSDRRLADLSWAFFSTFFSHLF